MLRKILRSTIWSVCVQEAGASFSSPSSLLIRSTWKGGFTITWPKVPFADTGFFKSGIRNLLTRQDNGEVQLNEIQNSINAVVKTDWSYVLCFVPNQKLHFCFENYRDIKTLTVYFNWFAQSFSTFEKKLLTSLTVMKPVRLLCYMFLLAFLGPDRKQSWMVSLSFWTHWPIETSHKFIQSQFVNKKQRIVHDQGASNITYSTVVFNFDVCQFS